MAKKPVVRTPGTPQRDKYCKLSNTMTVRPQNPNERILSCVCSDRRGNSASDITYTLPVGAIAENRSMDSFPGRLHTKRFGRASTAVRRISQPSRLFSEFVVGMIQFGASSKPRRFVAKATQVRGQIAVPVRAAKVFPSAFGSSAQSAIQIWIFQQPLDCRP